MTETGGENSNKPPTKYICLAKGLGVLGITITGSITLRYARDADVRLGVSRIDRLLPMDMWRCHPGQASDQSEAQGGSIAITDLVL